MERGRSNLSIGRYAVGATILAALRLFGSYYQRLDIWRKVPCCGVDLTVTHTSVAEKARELVSKETGGMIPE